MRKFHLEFDASNMDQSQIVETLENYKGLIRRSETGYIKLNQRQAGFWRISKNNEPYLVSFGRVEGTHTKVWGFPSKKEALFHANKIVFVLFGEHKFKSSEMKDYLGFDDGEFLVEVRYESQ